MASPPVPLTAGGDDDEARIVTSSPSVEGDAAPEVAGKATIAPPTTTTPTTAAPDPASEAAAELEEVGQAPAGEGEGKEGGEEVDLSDLMTLLFQHLRTDEGRAEFQALVEAEEAKAAAATETEEGQGEEEGSSRGVTEREQEEGELPVVK